MLMLNLVAVFHVSALFEIAQTLPTNTPTFIATQSKQVSPELIEEPTAGVIICIKYSGALLEHWQYYQQPCEDPQCEERCEFISESDLEANDYRVAVCVGPRCARDVQNCDGEECPGSGRRRCAAESCPDGAESGREGVDGANDCVEAGCLDGEHGGVAPGCLDRGGDCCVRAECLDGVQTGCTRAACLEGETGCEGASCLEVGMCIGKSCPD